MTIDSCWVRTKSDELAIDQGCTFDIASADRVRYFFSKFLRHSKGEFAGKPFELFDWQWKELIAPAFGWKMPDGTRRFRRVAAALPKKNGKSTLLSGLSLYGMVGDGEPGAEVYSAAGDRKQASIIYQEAKQMVLASDALTKRLTIKDSAKRIEYQNGGVWYQALSADADLNQGWNIHFLLFDELHTQPDRRLWDALRYGGAARRQPMIWWISTAGVDQKSLAYQQWVLARQVRDGETIDIGLLPCIYEASEDKDDWTSREVFAHANPSFPIAISERDWLDAITEAKASPINEASFKRYRLNMWTKQVTRWIPMDKWDAAEAAVPESEFKGKPCIIGLDLASTTDIAAAVKVFERDGRLYGYPRFWVPEDNVKARARENRTAIDEWVRQGLIRTTPSDTIDYDYILEDLLTDAKQFKIKEIAIDPWNASSITKMLQAENIKVAYVRTGFASISAATKDWGQKLRQGILAQPGNAVLTWMFANMAIEQDASGNEKPSKQAAQEKIDGVVAWILAHARWMEDPLAKKSVYDKRGVVTT